MIDLAALMDVPDHPAVPAAVSLARPGQLDLRAGVYVVASGAVVQRTSIGNRTAAELVGVGGVLIADTSEGLYRHEISALRRTAVAAVSPAQLFHRAPRVDRALFAAADRRVDALAAQHLAVQDPVVENRVRRLLPRLGQEWGVITRDGVVLPDFLSHRVFADLVGVRRPSFTTAVPRLEAQDILTRLPDNRWLIGADH